MTRIILILIFTIINTVSFSQAKSNDLNIRTYYAVSDPQYAIIKKINNRTGNVEEINIGRYPSIMINKKKQTLTLKTQLMPNLIKNKDSTLLLYTQHAYVNIVYSIIKTIPKNELPQYGTEGYIIQLSEDTTKKYIFLATSKTQTNFCDNVYILYQDDDNYFTSLDIPLMMWDENKTSETSANSNIEQKAGSQKGQIISGLDYIKAYKNRYPSDVSLFKKGILKNRILALIQEKNYKKFLSYSDVEFPINIINDERTFIHSGAAHSFTTYESAIDINFKTNEITVGILDNDKVFFFSENKDGIASNEFYKWYSEAKQNAEKNKNSMYP